MDEPIRKRVWVQNVAVKAAVLEARVAEIHARRGHPDPAAEVLERGVRELIQRAREAAYGENPIPTRWAIWWRGTLIEAAYQNLHAAQSLMAGLYDQEQIAAEVPEAAGRVEALLQRDDPRREVARQLRTGQVKSLTAQREQLRKLIEIGYAAADAEHSRLRSFRNTVLAAALLLTLFVTVFAVTVGSVPTAVPLCFDPSSTGEDLVCPAGSGAPEGRDILVIALLGLLGGALAGAVAIRNIKGTSTPYELPVALALLKVPFGALTAIGALIAIRGEFVPGLSELDSQVQILAYALVFGYAQQLLTGLIDRQAQQILDRVPSKGASLPRPTLSPPTASANSQTDSD
jgi:hypothetical protein